MKSNAVIVVLAFAIALEMAHAHNHGQIYCGRHLADVIARLCEMKGQNVMKKSLPEYNTISEENEWPWFRHFRLDSDRINRYKRLVGVASECCDKPCSEEVLLSYCGI
ncbi:unnamed protein product [Danaus chrysippus]|uniref:(African queen) hypothetical protein n=1 Tax=Danaus chrysippus TaxID=151541 RepID=A0A8J2W0B5_9NEOP|nr:unnamed protein product [Danaus chrysippus]